MTENRESSERPHSEDIDQMRAQKRTEEAKRLMEEAAPGQAEHGAADFALQEASRGNFKGAEELITRVSDPQEQLTTLLHLRGIAREQKNDSAEDEFAVMHDALKERVDAAHGREKWLRDREQDIIEKHLPERSEEEFRDFLKNTISEGETVLGDHGRIERAIGFFPQHIERDALRSNLIREALKTPLRDPELAVKVAETITNSEIRKQIFAHLTELRTKIHQGEAAEEQKTESSERIKRQDNAKEKLPQSSFVRKAFRVGGKTIGITLAPFYLLTTIGRREIEEAYQGTRDRMSGSLGAGTKQWGKRVLFLPGLLFLTGLWIAGKALKWTEGLIGRAGKAFGSPPGFTKLRERTEKIGRSGGGKQEKY